jgi:hypothetical protein
MTRVFAVTHFHHGYAKTEGSITSLKDIGNCTTAAMIPARVENLHNLIVKRFYDRLGEHFIHHLVRRRPCYHDARRQK